MIRVDRINGQNYADNIIDNLLLFEGGTWSIVSGSGTATLTTSDSFVGDSCLLIENNTPSSEIIASNSVQSTVIGISGTYQLSCYFKKILPLEALEGAVLVYRNDVLLDTQSITLGNTDADLDTDDTWIRFQSSNNYNLVEKDVITFQFRISSSGTSELTTSLYVDGLMLNRAERNNNVVPFYTKPLNSNISTNTGVYVYSDSATSTTPIEYRGTDIVLTNDGLGSQTNNIFGLVNSINVFNTSTNAFDFSGLEYGDTIDIRLDIDIITTTNNQEVTTYLEAGQGGFSYDIKFIRNKLFKTSGTYLNEGGFNSVYIVDDNTKNNPAQFKFTSDADADIIVNGWYVRVLKNKS